MLEEEIGYLKYRRIIKDSKGLIYHDKNTGRMIKLDGDCADEMLRCRYISILTPRIDERQIHELSRKQIHVHNSYLPEGILYLKRAPVGVIYPRYFEGYQTFNELYNEDEELILDNLKRAYYNNLELIKNDICNKDFAFKNIMFKGDDVQLIDLDGKLIGNRYNSTFNHIYQEYLRDLYALLCKKLLLTKKEDELELLRSMRSLFVQRGTDMEYDYPLHLIDEIEKKRILK